jgi:hypothetical protein
VTAAAPAVFFASCASATCAYRIVWSAHAEAAHDISAEAAHDIIGEYLCVLNDRRLRQQRRQLVRQLLFHKELAVLAFRHQPSHEHQQHMARRPAHIQRRDAEQSHVGFRGRVCCCRLSRRQGDDELRQERNTEQRTERQPVVGRRCGMKEHEQRRLGQPLQLPADTTLHEGLRRARNKQQTTCGRQYAADKRQHAACN